MKKRLACCAILLMTSALLMTACRSNSKENTAANVEVSIRETVYTADPRGAIDAIYSTIADHEIEEVDGKALRDYYNITPADLTEFVAYRSNAKNGLCDVAIMKPAANKKDVIREQLYLYKDARIEEFRNYDILNAYTIAQEAVILDQGDYVVMLMLPDNEAAQDLLDEYIPQ